MSRHHSRPQHLSEGKALTKDPIDTLNPPADRVSESVFEMSLPWGQLHEASPTDPFSFTSGSEGHRRAHFHEATCYERDDEEVVFRGSGSQPQAFMRSLIRSYAYSAEHNEVGNPSNADFKIFEDTPSSQPSEISLESPCTRKSLKQRSRKRSRKGSRAATGRHGGISQSSHRMGQIMDTRSGLTGSTASKSHVYDSTAKYYEVSAGTSFEERDSRFPDASRIHVHSSSTALVAARDVEYLGEAISPKKHHPIHKWTAEEREALCVLRRWYNVGPGDMAKVLNEAFAKDLILRQQPPFHRNMVDMQWVGARNLHAVRQAVCFETPFDDASCRYENQRRRLESAARNIGIVLQRRSREDGGIIKMRRKARRETPLIRQPAALEVGSTNKEVVQRERQTTLHEHKTTAPIARRLESMGRRPHEEMRSRRGHSSEVVVWQLEQATAALDLEDANLSVRVAGSLDLEHSTSQSPEFGSGGLSRVADAQELNSTIATLPTRPWHEMPSIFFRCFDETSAGVNSPALFRAGLFEAGDGEICQPMETGYPLFSFFTVNHLERRKHSSPFISVTGSLLWALHKAQQSLIAGKTPYIAVIDAHLAAQEGQPYYVSSILAEQRRSGTLKGPLRRMSYRATQEWWFWGKIPEEAIIRVIPFTHLRDLADAVPDVDATLRFTALDPTQSISRIRKALYANPIPLSVRTGHALGSIVATLGLGPTSSESHLAQMVYNLTQGWVLTVEQGSQAESTSEHICAAFTRSLKFFAGTIEDLPEDWQMRAQHAFVRGVISGSQSNNQEQEQKRGSASKNRRGLRGR